VRRLTGDAVDCSKRAEHPDCSDCWQIEILGIDGVLHHPTTQNIMEIYGMAALGTKLCSRLIRTGTLCFTGQGVEKSASACLNASWLVAGTEEELQYDGSSNSACTPLSSRCAQFDVASGTSTATSRSQPPLNLRDQFKSCCTFCFCRVMLCSRAVSVCPSVTFVYSVETIKCTFKFF